MNIMYKMQLLKLLRDYKSFIMENIKTTTDVVDKQVPVAQVQHLVEEDIRNWLNSGGGF